jgi:hypothetical protein
MAALRISLAVLILCLSNAPLAAEDSFDSILQAKTKETFEKIAEYAKANPDADDSDRAHRWLFATAISSGLEAEAVELAETYLNREDKDPTTAIGAQQVRMFGLAKNGKAEVAVQLYAS